MCTRDSLSNVDANSSTGSFAGRSSKPSWMIATFPLGCGDLDLVSSPVLSLAKTRDGVPGICVLVRRGPVGVPGAGTCVLGTGTGVLGTAATGGLGVAGAVTGSAVLSSAYLCSGPFTIASGENGFAREDPMGGDFYFVCRPHLACVHQYWHVSRATASKHSRLRVL